MRLHLDSTVSTRADVGQATPLGSTPSVAGSKSEALQTSGSGSQDSISISGPSSAINRLTSDRTARIDQIAASVRNGSYQIASSTLSNAIVAHSIS